MFTGDRGDCDGGNDDDDGDHGDGDGGNDDGDGDHGEGDGGNDDDDGDHDDGDDDSGSDRENSARSQDASLSRFKDLKFRVFSWEPGPSQWSWSAKA